MLRASILSSSHLNAEASSVSKRLLAPDLSTDLTGWDGGRVDVDVGVPLPELNNGVIQNSPVTFISGIGAIDGVSELPLRDRAVTKQSDANLPILAGGSAVNMRCGDVDEVANF